MIKRIFVLLFLIYLERSKSTDYIHIRIINFYRRVIQYK